jgi:hypothetical protein
MGLALDHPRFESLSAVCKYLLDEYASKQNAAFPNEPAFVFRGECGEFPTTKPSIARIQDLSRADKFRLAEISDWVALQLHREREELSLAQASVLLQHYGMPSCIVDFTGDLGKAIAFAGAKNSEIGRLAVVPYVHSETGPMFNFLDHPWAERAQRQAAFGLRLGPGEDLKAESTRQRHGIHWYECMIRAEEKVFCRQQVSELLKENNDVSAGFVRYYITRYVEEFAKLSVPLTEWLLKNVVIAPYCLWVERREEQDAIVYFRAADCLPSFEREIEIECSRRYWSEGCKDDSRERIQGVTPPDPGSVFVDPRTFHPDRYATKAP